MAFFTNVYSIITMQERPEDGSLDAADSRVHPSARGLGYVAGDSSSCIHCSLRRHKHLIITIDRHHHIGIITPASIIVIIL